MGGRVKIVIEHVIQDRIEGASFFGVGEDDDAEILFRHEHDARNEATDSPGVSDEFAAVIVAQTPAQSVIGEVGLQTGQRRWRIADRKDGLGGPHFLRALLA